MKPVHHPKLTQRSHSYQKIGKKLLLFCLLLTLFIMILEIAGGIFSKSLALLSDAGHLFTDFFALLSSFFAILIVSTPANYQKTYGYFRAEILVALLNGVLLIGVSIYLLIESYLHFKNPHPIQSSIMFGVALIGLLSNLITAFLLHRVKGENLNLRSAYIHLLSDTASSFGVIVGAILIYFTGWMKIDSILSFIISLLILFWASRLILDSIHILMESTPKHIQISELIESIKNEVKGIKEIHDLHIWEITTHMYAMTAHVIVEDCTILESMKTTEKINRLLAEKFHIEHVNLQYEC